jgi:thymidylate kinase
MIRRTASGIAPSGFTVALIGCDGAGKTTVARELERRSSLPVRYLYMGVSSDSSDRQLITTRIAHVVKRRRGAPPDTAGPPELPPAAPPPAQVRRRLRRSARAALRLANRVADEWYRQALASFSLRRGQIVVFDRHFVADFHATEIAVRAPTATQRLHGLMLARLYPRPDLVIFLDAPPEVLHARKGEGTLSSLARRRSDYLRLARTTDRFAVVDATQPLDAVVATVTRILRDHRGVR